MVETRALLRHFLAALAYRTQKATRGASPAFEEFAAGDGVRTPKELVRHMTRVLDYARFCFVGTRQLPDPLATLDEELRRFHQTIEDVAAHLDAGTALRDDMTFERVLQGPFADAMTHAGQLAMLRRLSGDPIPPENFAAAAIESGRLGVDQAASAAPAQEWPEAPAGWVPSPNRGG